MSRTRTSQNRRSYRKENYRNTRNMYVDGTAARDFDVVSEMKKAPKKKVDAQIAGLGQMEEIQAIYVAHTEAVIEE